MRLLITDDESPARERLRRLLGELTDYSVVGEAADGRQALEQTESLSPDIVLLDIRMPVMDGLEAARHMNLLNEPPAVIFTTAYGDHALEAFETHAVDYLLKPVRLERLRNALEAAARPNRAQALSRSQGLKQASGKEARRHICARVRGNLQLIPIDDVFFFHAEHKYVSVRHGEGEVLIEEPLKDLEDEFGQRFLRIHRNALVALEKVSGLGKSHDGRIQIVFKDIDERLEISRRHLAAVRKVIREL
jgi:two-component system response regulator AlgR